MHLRDSYWLRVPRLAALLGLAALTGCQGSDSNPTAEAQRPAAQADIARSAPDGSETISGSLPGRDASTAAAVVSPESVDASGLVVLGSESTPSPTAPAAESLTAESPDNSAAQPLVVEPSAAASDVADRAVVAEVVAEVVVEEAVAPETSELNAEAVAIEAAVDSSSSGKTHPAEANVATAAERNQTLAADWPIPQAVLFVSGQQHGYIEPCGCTGLENQKGGLIRRDTLLTQLRERGWEIIPIDVGNQVRRIGRQPELKFQTTVDAFRKMGYRAAALGIDDLQLSSIELIQLAGSDGLNESPFLSANVSVIDESFFPSHRIVEAGGRKIGITAVLGNEHKTDIQSRDIQFFDAVERLRPIADKLQQEGCDFKVLLAHASIEESAELARQVPGFDLVVTAGGFGEPTLTPEKIEGSPTVMVTIS